MLCDYYGNPWIGLFVRTNDQVTIVPKDSLEKFCDVLDNSLKTEIIRSSIAGSNLLGLYSVMNNKGMVVPSNTEPDEIALLKNHGLNVYSSKEKLNAHGNNLAVNDKKGIVSARVNHIEKRNIEDHLGIELFEVTVAGHYTVGSACALTNKGFLVHYGATNSEFERVSKYLGLAGEKGSVNMGVGFVSLGILANVNGYVVGSQTSGFEVGKIHSALGFL